MKFVVTKSDLKAALNYVTIALSGNAKDPATSHALVTIDKDGQAKLSATDRFVFCETQLDIRSGAEGRMLVPGPSLVALSAEVEEGDIEFEMTPDSVEVKAGRASISLPTMSPDLFPLPQDKTDRVSFSKYDVTTLEEALKYIKVFVGSDKDAPDLMIAEMRNKKLMASDKIRIGTYQCESFPDAGFVIQTRGLSGALDFLKMESGEDVLIGKTENFTWWKGLRAVLAFRCDERTFPADIEETMGKISGEDHFKIQQGCLEHMIRRLRISLDDTNSKMTLQLSGDGEGGTLKIQTVNSRGKTSVETVPVVRTGGTEDVNFSLGWKDLLSVIQAGLFTDAEVTLTHASEYNVLKVSREYETAEIFGLISLRD